jgi:8-oxo-dGTP pyrophosphatase MutT (NUDIX family)
MSAQLPPVPASDGFDDPGDELADLVDLHDNVVGRATRREIRRRKLRCRGAAVLCRNAAGHIYVHQRTATKDVFPGMYDVFVAGLVAAGESYEAAARRELTEELGISGVEPRFVLRRRYDGADDPSWKALFEATWDGTVTPQPSEIAWGDFLPEDELRGRLDVWPFTPTSVWLFRAYLARRG